MATARRAIGAFGPKTYLFAAAVGVIGGLVATAFQLGRHGLKELLVGEGNFLDAALALDPWVRFSLPIASCMAASLLAYGLTRRRESQGMADVMEAVTLRRGEHLRVGPTIARALSSFVLVAGGGSVGREGPIVYLSASLGTRLSRFARIPMGRLGLFTGCGVSAGMAGAYYAPLGASLFAMEVVLGNFAIDIFAPVVVAAVTANFVVQGFAAGPFQGLMKGYPMYPDLPDFPAVQASEILLFLALGCLAACGAFMFIKTMATTELLFRKIPIPALWRLPLGGVFLGVISIWMPETWAGGHDTANRILAAAPPVEFVLALLILKIMATSITVGAGGSGGLFTPSILVGLCVGILFGFAAEILVPHAVEDPRSYGMVGMAAGLAATTQAPIMAVVLLAEMTRGFDLLVPFLVAALAGSVSARYLGLESIYLSPLIKRGVRIPEGIEETALTTTRVRDIMREEAVWISETATFDMIVGMVKKTRKDFIYVADRSGALCGAINIHDIKNYLGDESLANAVIASDIVVATPTVTEAETLAEILDRFDDPEIHELPVVGEQGQVIGIVDRRDLISVLSAEVLQNRALRAKFVMPEGATDYVEIPRGHALSRINVPAEMIGQRFGDTDFRRKTHLSVLTLIRKGKGTGKDERMLPEPDIVLQEGDAFIVLGAEEAVRKLGGQA